MNKQHFKWGTIVCVTLGERQVTARSIHQKARSPDRTPTHVWRPEKTKKAFEITFTEGFRRPLKARSPGLTPTHTWRPERGPRRRLSLRLLMVFEGRSRHDHQALRPRMFGVRRGPRRRLSLRLLMVFEGRSRHDHQGLRPRMSGVRRGPRKRLSVRLLMVFETG